MSEFFDLHRQLAQRYGSKVAKAEAVAPKATALDEGGFVTEVAGKVILTAPATSVHEAWELPEPLRERWERAASANPYYQWIGGRFVEAERANRNGAFWSTADLQFGEMSVKNGPLNWLHEGRKVIGTIADHALVASVPAAPVQQFASSTTNPLITMATGASTTTNSIFTHPTTAAERPFISAISTVWKWLYPEEAKVIEKSSDEKTLYYSMECVAREMQCMAGESGGCGESFDYMTAMTAPDKVCEHIAQRSSHRRMVDPYFLGGAVIVPPVRPGWGEANAEVLRQAAALAEQVAPADAEASQWELLMGAVLAYAEV
jgi:hypothetical protein